MGAFNKGFDTVNLHHPTVLLRRASAWNAARVASPSTAQGLAHIALNIPQHVHQHTGARSKAWCLLIHAEASLPLSQSPPRQPSLLKLAAARVMCLAGPGPDQRLVLPGPEDLREVLG
jgi:hypothetical protein